MLKTIPSQRKMVDPSLELKSKNIHVDSGQCFPELLRLDTIDNPVLFSQTSETERNIFKQMKYERNRLYSFQDKWPLPSVTPESLAEAGLFYLQHEDKVQCPFCFVIISNWTRGDNPLREHMRKKPKCSFLMGCNVGNIPLVPEIHHAHPLSSIIPGRCYMPQPTNLSYKPKHPRMSDVKRRILSFSGWPLRTIEPQQLSECGLYYSGVADVVTCFFCGGTLGNWEPNDDPWIEHRKFFPDCTFLAMAKNRNRNSPKSPVEYRMEFTESPEFTQDPVNEMLSTDITSDIIGEAQDIFPENLVLEAVKRKDGKVLSLQELCDDILEFKQEQKEEEASLPIPDETRSRASDSASASNDVLLCKVCMDREKGAVFQPCGHFVSCWNCANLIANCPVCRRPIMHKIRTYIS